MCTLRALPAIRRPRERLRPPDTILIGPASKPPADSSFPTIERWEARVHAAKCQALLLEAAALYRTIRRWPRGPSRSATLSRLRKVARRRAAELRLALQAVELLDAVATVFAHANAKVDTRDNVAAC